MLATTAARWAPLSWLVFASQVSHGRDFINVNIIIVIFGHSVRTNFAWLIINKGSDEWKTHLLTRKISVGRRQSNQTVLGQMKEGF